MLNFLLKVPLKYLFITEKHLKTYLKNLKNITLSKKSKSSLEDKPNYGTTYLNPFVIIPKSDSIKCVLEARRLNSNKEQSDKPCPIEPFAPQLASANKNYNCAINLTYAYAHTPLFLLAFLQVINFSPSVEDLWT